MFPIKIDSREKALALKEFLEKSGQVEIIVEQLPVGDYWINGIIIERKSCSDLFHSLIDGRLFRQLEALKLSTHRPLLLVEGSAPQELTRLAPNATRGLVASILVRFGIPIIWCKTQEESARWIITIAKQHSVPQKRPVRPVSFKPEKIRDRQLFLLAGLPGIGRTRAVKLLERFGNVRAVLSADFDELREVPGIGEYHAGVVASVAGALWEGRESIVKAGLESDGSGGERE